EPRNARTPPHVSDPLETGTRSTGGQMSEGPRTMTAERRGLIGPGKDLYEQYRAAWDVYKHPLPEWDKIGWEAWDVWNQVAERAAHDSSEHEIRKALWLGHGHEGLYGDDGEMQCNIGGCMLDFKRDPLGKIIAKL